MSGPARARGLAGAVLACVPTAVAAGAPAPGSLWFYRTGSPIHGAAPITYMLDGRQYVLIPSGTIITAFGLPQS